jgi:hypothetical protein
MSTENNFSLDESSFKIKSRVILGQPVTPAIIKTLVNKKIVKNERQAAVLLTSVFSVLVIVTYFLFAQSVNTPEAIIDPALLN